MTIGLIAEMVIGSCVEFLMHNAVKTITPKTANFLAKTAMAVGAVAVSDIIGKSIGDSIDETIAEAKRQAWEQERFQNVKVVDFKPAENRAS